MEKTVSVKLSPKELAEEYWELCSDEMADFYNHLYECAGCSNKLMMQGLYTLEECEKREDNSLEAFQYMFASAFKHMA